MPTASPKSVARAGYFQSQTHPFGLIWVAMITSAANAPWSCDVTIVELARAGLPAPSVVRTAKIACIEPAGIERRAGRLDKATAKAVAQKLKGFLGSA